MSGSLRVLGVVCAVMCLAPQGGLAAEVVRVGGTGMALAALRLAGDRLAAQDSAIRVEVLTSLGTPGGLRALSEGAIDVAVTGRSLAAQERADGTTEAGCVATPLLFASSHPAPSAIAKVDLPKIYASPAPTWPDGTPLKILLRSRAGSENAYLAAAVPGMEAALDIAYKRPGVPILTTDQENADVAARTSGSFAIMTLLQIRAERLALRPVALDGVAPTPENLAEGTYPLQASVCIVLPPSPTPAATRFVAFLKSPQGETLIRSLGAILSK